ncbi:MAG: protein jag [Clostridia bacterium]|nr:protein jag [Clostridia bacterium]
MRSMEFSGRTVDEAIFHGLNEMGVTIDQVDIITVQSESRGLFGLGARNAIVRLVERDTPVVPDFAAINEERRAEREEARRERGDRRDERRDNRRSDRREDRRDDRRDDRRTNRRPQREEAPAQEIPYSIAAAEDIPCARFLQELLIKMGVDGKVSAFEGEDGIKLKIDSNTDGLLIGRRGETLDALQYIVSLYENKDRKENGYRRVSVDTEGYRARREETLKRLARKNALQVARSGRAYAMEPMNPYERRVIHSALQSFRGVTTHSEGEEPNRRVVITPEN